jgi:hypothetical protein
MSKEKIVLSAGALILIAAISLYVVIVYKSSKITTFDECEKAGWLVHRIAIYDGSDSTDKICELWGGKKLTKQEIRQPDKVQVYSAGEQREKAITDYLLTQNQFSWKNKEDSRNFCVIDDLNPEQELFPKYVWALCQEFAMENGVLKEESGSSGPIKISYPNELSYYDPSKFSYEAPGDGTGYGIGIKKIFPANVQDRIAKHDIEPLIQKINKIASESFGI